MTRATRESSDFGSDFGSVLARVDALFSSGLAGRRRRGRGPGADDVRDLQVGALRHPDPNIRRSCLWVLDHHANDVSMPVFAQALRDGAEAVRDMALHSLACEGCKSDELCLADVVPPLVRVLEEDPKPDLRVKALTALVGLAGRDPRAGEALARAAHDNSDAVVRRCAADAVEGRYVVPKKRSERRQRRHAALGHGSLPGRA